MKRVRLLLLLGFFSLTGTCESQEEQNSYFAAIVVTDFERSLNWYTETLDFEIVNQNNYETRGFKQANLKRETVRLELIELSSAVDPMKPYSDQTKKPIMTGLFKIGFSVSDFDAKVETWQSGQTIMSGTVVEDPVTKKRMVILNDPDGNRVQIFEK